MLILIRFNGGESIGGGVSLVGKYNKKNVHVTPLLKCPLMACGKGAFIYKWLT